MIGAFIALPIGAVPDARSFNLSGQDEGLPDENTGGRAPLVIPKAGDVPASRWRGEPPR